MPSRIWLKARHRIEGGVGDENIYVYYIYVCVYIYYVLIFKGLRVRFDNNWCVYNIIYILSKCLCAL